MSDHLIAEANRHARALTDERNNLVVEMNLLREWQREVIQNAKAHHAERKDAIARAERAEAELATERARMEKIETGCHLWKQRAEKAEADLAKYLSACPASPTEEERKRCQQWWAISGKSQ